MAASSLASTSPGMGFSALWLHDSQRSRVAEELIEGVQLFLRLQ
jgi:hypothetical protein